MTTIHTPWGEQPAQQRVPPCRGHAVESDLAVETFGPLHKYTAANDNSWRVVGLTGAAGSGKSTAAAYLQTKGFTLVKFAGPLKDMCRAIGMSESMIEGDEKERPASMLQGKTPRQAMQWLGTEWGRDMIGPHFWIGLWEARALDVLDQGGRVVVDDCRFENEADAVRKLGGFVMGLTDRGGLSGRHASEDRDWEADRYHANYESLGSLYASLDMALTHRLDGRKVAA